MTDYVLTGLVKRRAELSGEANALRTRLAAISADLDHLDAVIRQFDPNHDIASIRPKRMRHSDAAGRGETSRAVLRVLREAVERLTTAEVTQRMAAARHVDTGDRLAMVLLTKRVGTTLSRQKAKGSVRYWAEPGAAGVWEVAR